MECHEQIGNLFYYELSANRNEVNHLRTENTKYHMKVLLNSFHLNGHTLGFHPQTLKLEPPCT